MAKFYIEWTGRFYRVVQATTKQIKELLNSGVMLFNSTREALEYAVELKKRG